jgi:eukaryotic-like serine/threonine-protein kinase
MSSKNPPETNLSASEIEARSVAFGKYQLLGLIGKGGMAEVYLARPRGQKRLVAIKCIRQSLTKDRHIVEMFLREGKLAVQLNHDAIVKTYEIGRVRGRYFICMEYISGVDLTVIPQRCRGASGKRLPIPHALYIAMRVCEGLNFAHELADPAGSSLNIVNRDVSPSNIRISFEGEVKLLDFGIAKTTTGLSAEIGLVKGKFRHMSPEQVRGLPLDRRSDIFSVGIVLHEMLTLEKLFRGDSDFQVMDQVRKAEVRPPSAMNSRLPPEIDAIVLKALQKEPQDRYPTAGAMAEELARMLPRYNFDKSELRDLVRDLGREEYLLDLKRTEACLSDEPQTTYHEEVDENYGEFIEILTDPAPPSEKVEKQAAATPRWLIGLLILSVAMLIFAVVLFFLFV